MKIHQTSPAQHQTQATMVSAVIAFFFVCHALGLHNFIASATSTNAATIASAPERLMRTPTTFTTIPSKDTFILSEDSTNELTADNEGLFSITSNVPVTFVQYNDNSFVDGEQPLFPNDALVAIISDCSTSETTMTPLIVWGDSQTNTNGGSVSVTLNSADGSSIDGSSMGFLGPASYQATWNWNSWSCNIFPTPSPYTVGKSEDSSTPPTIVPLFSIEGKGAPTKSPVVPASEEPTSSVPTYSPTEPQSVVEEGGGSKFVETPADQPSAAFRGRSTSFLAGVTLMGMIILPFFLHVRNDGGNVSGIMSSFGKFAVVALATSAMLPNKVSISREKSNFKTNAVPNSKRSLQDTCTYNVQVLIDGCFHPLTVEAPLARTMDAVVENVAHTPGEGSDYCNYEYTADINVPTTTSDGADNTVELDMSSGMAEADPLDFGECMRPVDGRPFMDKSGGPLQASPLFFDRNTECIGELDISAELPGSWVGISAPSRETIPNAFNTTNYQQTKLGEEWIQRALGEHASIASFSAFSIALMTNGAPSTLVEDALKAGLDEIRHTKMSFEIASRLTRREVRPGPLPPSNIEFGRNLTTLALAVAREGCVDETLSALAAAVEADELRDVHKIVDGKYSVVDTSTSAWIGEELHTIAMDESRHAALAWKTLLWVCRADSQACAVVEREVFGYNQLETRFHKRFDEHFINRAASLNEMKFHWEKIHNTLGKVIIDASSMERHGSICTQTQGSTNTALLTASQNILRGVLCNADTANGMIA